MATANHSKLNVLYTHVRTGVPITSEELAQLGISSDLAVHYVKSGWLTRLARGVFCRPGETLEETPSLLLLQRRIDGLHVGGKSALERHGIRQYVSQRPVLQLYGWDAAKLPTWFTAVFAGEYHRKRLFQEDRDDPMHAGPFNQEAGMPRISSPERALLEVLSEVGVRQALQEARELTESTYTLRAPVLRALLRHCTSVKTVRLCLQLGKDLQLPWAQKLDPEDLPIGSRQRWVGRTNDGLLVLKP